MKHNPICATASDAHPCLGQEEMKTKAQKILRENATATLHMIPPTPRPARDPNSSPQFASPTLPGAAAPRTTPWGAGTYDGRELQPYTGRNGSMRAFTLPSKGAV